MTAKVKIENAGNQPGDVLLLCGLSEYAGGIKGENYASFTGDPGDSIRLARGAHVYFTPPTGYFSRFCPLLIKAQHGADSSS